MKEERMMILSMLKEGKINSEEAVKLLEALEESKTFMPEEENKEKTKEKIEEFKKTIKKQGKKAKNIGADLGEKAGSIGAELGEKAGDFGAELGNKIANLFSGMKDKNNFDNFLGMYETTNANIKNDISHIENPIIDLKAINGSIIVENWDENHMLIEVNCRYKSNSFNENSEFYDFYEEENKLVFVPKFENNISINLKICLPNKAYDEIRLNTSNGQIKIDDFVLNKLILNTSNAPISTENIKAQEISIKTKNGRINLNDISSPIIKASSTNSSINIEDINCEELNAFTKNSRILFSDILANNIVGSTTNGTIETIDISSNEIILTTSNGKIILDDINPEKIEKIELATSNASIDANIGDIDKETYFDIETSLGSIDLEIPNLVYKVNEQVNLGRKKIVAHSINLDEEKEHLKLFASTSNASVKIW